MAVFTIKGVIAVVAWGVSKIGAGGYNKLEIWHYTIWIQI